MILTKKQKQKFNNFVMEKYGDVLNDFSDLLGDGYTGMSNLFYLYNKKYLHWLDCDPDVAVSEKETRFRRKFYKLLQIIGPSMLKCKQVYENKNTITLPDKPVIFIANHGFYDDILATVLAINRHAYLVMGSLPILYNAFGGAAALLAVGCVIINRKNKKSRASAIFKCSKLLEYGTDIILFPEGGWNKTISIPVLDLWRGVYTISHIAKCDVVPITHYVRDMELFKRNNFIHTFIDEPIPLYEMPEKEALTYLREIMATRQWEMMEKYGISTRDEELQGFSSSDEKWHAHLRERMKGVSRYDSSIEKCADYRPKDIIRPEDVFSSIAQINDITPYNAEAVIYAQRHIKEIKENDFQRLY